jgi:hypothetical protein
MAHQTQPYNRSFRGSLGAGMGSLIGGSGKTYYILEHKVSSKYHRAGESQEIIVNQIELGRDPKCQVRFDESFTTVSRRHAAIIRDGDRWKLIALSETNPTYLNGKVIQREWYLQNGDEIQLSANGPKLGFIIPTGNKATVGSIGLSRRLSLFRHQALRPYKQALTALSIVLLLVIAGAVGWGFYAHDQQKQLEAKYAQLEADKIKIEEDAANLEAEMLSIKENSLLDQAEKDKQLKDLEVRASGLRNTIAKTQSELEALKESGVKPAAPKPAAPTTTPGAATAVAGTSGTAGAGTTTATEAFSEVTQCNAYVYSIFAEKWDITDIDGRVEEILRPNPTIGTGFLLNNGKFVTARHVIEPWVYYPYMSLNDEAEKFFVRLNLAAYNGGKVVVHYKAISGSGQTLTFRSDQFLSNRGGEVEIDSVRFGTNSNGRPLYAYTRTSAIIRYDWACFDTGLQGGLNFNFAPNLTPGTELEILGFPDGRGAENLNHIVPINSSCRLSRQGLDAESMTMMVSNENIEEGNSGGPVLHKNNGSYEVVGLVSGTTKRKGRIIPISAIAD